MTLIAKTLEAGERRGFAVSVHPSRTAIIKNFREYLVMFPQKDGGVAYEVREPLFDPTVRGVTRSELVLFEIVKNLR